MSENLATILTETARALPDHVAIKLDDVELTYALLDEGSARIAGLLQASGHRARRPRRDHAARTSPTSRSSTTGSCAPGGVVVPMNVLLKEREVGVLPRATPARSCCSPGTTSPRPRTTRRRARRAPSVIVVEPGEFEQLVWPGRAGPRRWPTRRTTTPR